MQRYRFASAQRMMVGAALAAMTALAQAGTGPYIGGEGAAQFIPPQELKNNKELQGNTNDFGEVRFKTGYVGGGMFGYTFENGLRPEIELAYRRSDLKGFTPAGSSKEVHAQGAQRAFEGMINLWYELRQPSGPLSTVHPYFGGGVGAVRVDGVHPFLSGYPNPPKSWDAEFAYQGGLGVGFDLTRNLTLSMDYRYVRSNTMSFQYSPGERDGHYQAHSAGMSLRLSFSSPPPPPYVAVVKEQALTPPPPPPVDRCTLDADRDGVNDCVDRCPNTPPGFQVDEYGCIVEQTLVLRAVNFEFDSDRLTDPSKDTLNEIATALVSQPRLHVEIDGHTDATGLAEYNRILSLRRAKSVMKYLITQSVNPDVLSAKGFGKERPIADNSTEEGRTANRRVEFVVLDKPITIKILEKDATPQSKAAAANEPERIKKLYRKKKQ